MKRTILILTTLVFLAGSGFGGYRLYERHLSSDLKRILVAATDPAASENDVRAYVRDARLLNETMRHLREPGAEYAQFDALVKLRSQYWEDHIPVPAKLQVDMTEALAEAKTRHNEQKKQDDADEKRADSEEATAKAL